MERLVRCAIAVGLAVMLLGSFGVGSGSAASTVSCSLYASPSGSDSGSGSASSPFRSAQKLVDSLHAGQTGCLRGGTYSQATLRFSHGGAAGAPIVLSGYPGELATVTGGFVYVPSGSDYVTIENVHIDTTAASQVGVQVMASNVSLVGNDITNGSTGHSCIILGSNAGWGQAVNVSISANVIHQCGSPADGNQDHAIYFDSSLNGTVTNNVIWGAAAFAIHLYQNAQGNQITHNVIADNGYGVIFAGSSEYASSNNTVAYNIITGSSAGYGAQSWWGGSTGAGNVLKDNCLANNQSGDVSNPASGFTTSNDVSADPQYLGATAHNYTLQSGSACLSVVGYDTAAMIADGGTSTTTTTTTDDDADDHDDDDADDDDDDDADDHDDDADDHDDDADDHDDDADDDDDDADDHDARRRRPRRRRRRPRRRRRRPRRRRRRPQRRRTTTTTTTATASSAASPLPVAPAASTSAASRVSSTGATVSGQVVPNGRVTVWWFQYGRRKTYDHATGQHSMAAGTSLIPVSQVLSGLSSGVTFHYRIVARWSNGATTYGADRTFTTTRTYRAATARRVTWIMKIRHPDRRVG